MTLKIYEMLQISTPYGPRTVTYLALPNKPMGKLINVLVDLIVDYR